VSENKNAALVSVIHLYF